jgi:pyruvate formate lyase activating enzyme
MGDAMIVHCELCPKECAIAPGQSGECRIRVNFDGRLCAVTYGFPSAVHRDPIEKKPLFHFLPGTGILSVATVGCNLHCKNCQNWELSQRNPEEAEAVFLPPADVVSLAQRSRCPSVAYTYSDPTVFYEYMFDTARLAREAGLRNVWVTAGYINDRPLRELCTVLDAANIDLKAFSDRFYRDVCDATLAPVLHSIVTAKSLGVLVEVTNLVIPTLNDGDRDLQQLSEWVCRETGPETPLHFSRFQPRHRMLHLPPTPVDTLVRARDIAAAAGLKHVYIGNVMVPGSLDTACPQCGGTLIRRIGYHVLENNLIDGHCPVCGKEAYGRWS